MKDADYKDAWEHLKERLERRVERMRYDAGDRRPAYEDVLLLMGDLEDNRSD